MTLGGCDAFSTSNPNGPPATVILELSAEPNPVAIGDTTVFTAVVRPQDRSESALRFAWYGPWGIHGETLSNRYTWVADADTGAYKVLVEIHRRDGDYTRVTRTMMLTVFAD
jgi:hypothetical protein